jgi:hypothetical protein
LCCCLQRCLLTSAAGGEQGGRQHVRRQDYRQEGAQGQGGLPRERDQGSQEVIVLNTPFSLGSLRSKGLSHEMHLAFDDMYG